MRTDAPAAHVRAAARAAAADGRRAGALAGSGGTEGRGARVRCTTADARLLALAEASAPGREVRVHSVFARVVNLEVDGRLVTLAARSLDEAPMTAALPLDSVAPLQLAQGMRGSMADGAIAVGPAWIDLSRAMPWHCRLPAFAVPDPAAVDALVRAIEGVGHRLLQDASADAPASAQDLLSNALGERTRRLLAALAADGDEIAASTAPLLGLGGGLTPAGDDFCVGAMAALRLPGAPLADAADQLAEAIRGSAARTNDVSRAALLEAADGRVRERIVGLLAALVDRAVDIPRIEIAAREVLEIGHSSGADICSGIIGAMRILSRAAPRADPAEPDADARNRSRGGPHRITDRAARPASAKERRTDFPEELSSPRGGRSSRGSELDF